MKRTSWGANDPYSSLGTTLKAEIDQAAWESLHSATSRPFDKPKSGPPSRSSITWGMR